MMWLIGIGPFLMVHLPIVAIAATIGVFLFYVQHQFEDTFWEESEKCPIRTRRSMAAPT